MTVHLQPVNIIVFKIYLFKDDYKGEKQNNQLNKNLKSSINFTFKEYWTTFILIDNIFDWCLVLGLIWLFFSQTVPTDLLMWMLLFGWSYCACSIGKLWVNYAEIKNIIVKNMIEGTKAKTETWFLSLLLP